MMNPPRREQNLHHTTFYSANEFQLNQKQKAKPSIDIIKLIMICSRHSHSLALLLFLCASYSVGARRAELFSLSMSDFTVQEGGIQDYQSDPYDMSTYVNPNDTYVPSSEVEQGTDISSGDFQKNQDYYIDGATTPIALFCLGFVALVVLNCCLCCGAAKICTSQNSTENSHTLSCGEYCTKLVFAAFIIICFLAAHILYLGYSDIGDGLDIMRTSTNIIATGFDDMHTHGETLYEHSRTLKTLCTPYGCLEQAQRVQDGANYMLDDIEDIPEDVHDINVAIDDVDRVMNLLTFVMYCVLMVSLVVYVLTEFCCKAAPGGAICCGNIAFFVVAFIGILWMVITSVTADFCYENPTINTLNLMQANKGQMYLVWYSSCHSGENPQHRYTNHSYAANEDVIAFVGNDTSVAADAILQQTSEVTQDLSRFKQATLESCSPVQSGWLSLLNEGVCDSFFLGVRMIWICEVAACISLFFLMITGAIMGKAAKASEESILPLAGTGAARRGRYEVGDGDDDLEFEDEEEQSPEHGHQHHQHHQHHHQRGGGGGGGGRGHGGGGAGHSRAQLGENHDAETSDRSAVGMNFEY